MRDHDPWVFEMLWETEKQGQTRRLASDRRAGPAPGQQRDPVHHACVLRDARHVGSFVGCWVGHGPGFVDLPRSWTVAPDFRRECDGVGLGQ
jgi:hypothetical protein